MSSTVVVVLWKIGVTFHNDNFSYRYNTQSQKVKENSYKPSLIHSQFTHVFKTCLLAAPLEKEERDLVFEARGKELSVGQAP